MSQRADSDKSSSPLRSGDVVRVRSKEEILATLDAQGRLDALPFMPEMLAFAGQEMRVRARAHKTCDTINMAGTSRRMDRTVHLAGARCDGSAHGGCQAGCLLFWREEWLRWPDGSPIRGEQGESPNGAPATAVVTTETLDADTRAGTSDKGEPLYRCQTTELLNATRPLSSFEFHQYVEDVRSGNTSPRTVILGLLVTLFNKYQKVARRLPRWLQIRGGAFYPFLRGTGPSPAPPPLDLKPGELVEIKSKAGIIPTLGLDNRNRGLWFDAEMVPFCGRRSRVLRRIEKIIDEGSGRMLKLRDCILLDGVECTGRYNRFCPRAAHIYWREEWLRRVDEPTGTDQSGTSTTG